MNKKNLLKKYITRFSCNFEGRLKKKFPHFQVLRTVFFAVLHSCTFLPCDLGRKSPKLGVLFYGSPSTIYLAYINNNDNNNNRVYLRSDQQQIIWL